MPSLRSNGFRASHQQGRDRKPGCGTTDAQSVNRRTDEAGIAAGPARPLRVVNLARTTRPEHDWLTSTALTASPSTPSMFMSALDRSQI